MEPNPSEQQLVLFRGGNDGEGMQDQQDIGPNLDLTTESPSTITEGGRLPMELVFIIADCSVTQQSDLYEWTLVNQQFYSRYNRVLWQAPQLRNDTSAHQFLMCICMGQPPNLGHFVRKLYLCTKYWNDLRFSLLMPHLTYLEDLRINTVPCISNDSFYHFPRHCPHLQTLTLPRHLSGDPIRVVGQHCHQLTHLNLNQGTYPPTPGMYSTLRDCPLTSLTIQLFGLTLDISLNQHIQDLLHLTRLTHLELKKCYSISVRSLLNSATATTTTAWPSLTHLKIENCTYVTSQTIIQLIRSHPRLVDICFTGCVEWDDTTLDGFGTTGLQKVDFSLNQRITGEGIRRLITNSPQLTWLILQGFDGVTKTDLPRARIGKAKNSLTLNKKSLNLMR